MSQNIASAIDSISLYGGVENTRYFYHGDHLGSSSWITDKDGNALQYISYLPYGQLFWNLKTTSYDASYKFIGKERDSETGFDYFGARYYSSPLGVWLSVDPLANERAWSTPYSYCQNNPVGRLDPTGALDSDHLDTYGNVIAHYDDGDKSVYVHKYGTTKAQVDVQRTASNNTGGTGTKIGEIGGNIDVSGIMTNKLKVSTTVAKGLGIVGYFNAVKPGAIWDLKNNKNTIFGVAWAYDGDNGAKTTFSFGSYANMSAADVGNYHAGYTGRYTYNGEGMSYNLLWRGAGAAETAKSITEFRLLDAVRQTFEIFGSGVVPSSPPYGDRVPDFIWNTTGMIDADKNKNR